MSSFKFEALDLEGHTVNGVLEKEAMTDVAAILKQRGLTPLEIRPVRRHRLNVRAWFTHKQALSSSTLASLTHQFSTLVRAGLPLEESLLALSAQSGQPRVQSIVNEVRAQILEGRSLAQALSKFPKAFPELYVRLVEAGEQSGQLDDVLERLAVYTESRRSLQQKVVLAFIYPALLTVVSILVVAGLLVSVVPQVTRVFLTTGQRLPVSTRLLITISHALQSAPWLWIGLAVGIPWLISRALKRPEINLAWHERQLRLPLVGRLVRGLNSARFTTTLGILTSSGVPLLTALQSAVRVVENRPMRSAVEQSVRDVAEGRNLSSSLAKTQLFPPVVIHLIASGESSGKLDVMLERASQAQTRELETWVAALTAILEPAIILAMGGVVLFIVLAILAPIMEMNQLIR